MSPVVRWGLRYAAVAAVCFTLPALPAPVVPFIVVVGLFAAWALLADDVKQDEKNARPDLRDLPLVPAAGRARYRPRPVSST